MAVLDPRVLELIETLAFTRLDWLAFEILDGIRAGWLPEESAKTLEIVRRSVRTNAQPTMAGEPYLSSTEAEPMPVEAQAEWAASYVDARLGDLLEQIKVSVEALNFIVDESTGRFGKVRERAHASDAPVPRAVVVSPDDEEGRESDRAGVAASLEGLPRLREALAEWVSQSRATESGQ